MSVVSPQNPVQLYRHLLRMIRKLPKDTQEYYKHHVRQNYNSHSDEVDPERIKQIMERATEDAQWVLNKYTKMEKS